MNKERSPMNRIVARGARALATAVVMLALSAATVAAHSQTVDPNGDGLGFTKPISNAWAQAHCNAASPLIVADRSDGVVAFNPAAALPCPLVPNPGGEIHGD
jgi:hypothetical protein